MITNLITINDMKGEFYLALDSDYETTTFNTFISELQYEALIDLMGYPCYNDFETGLGVVPIDAKWTNLRDGVDYNDCSGYLNKWRGLKYMLLPLVFSKWIEFNHYKQDITGTLISQNENSTPVDLWFLKKIANKAYNEYIKRYNEAYNFMYTNESDYLYLVDFHKDLKIKGLIEKGSIS